MISRLYSSCYLQINNSIFSLNEIYDDTIHVVYSKNIQIKNSKIQNAFRDAIDVDISRNIVLENLEIDFANNDGIDLMETDAKIIQAKIKNSKDIIIIYFSYQ